MSDETLGELSRRLDRFEQRHDRERQSADARHLDAAVYVAERNHMQTQIADLNTDLAAAVTRLQGEIGDLKSKLTWGWRVALTGAVLPTGVLIVGWLLTRGMP